MQFARWWSFALALGSLACGSRLSVGDLGNDSGSSSGTMGGGGAGFSGAAGAGGTMNLWDASSDVADVAVVIPPNDLQGSWKGYVENFQFGDQSDAVLVSITSNAGAGQITFGNSAAPPPATDPNIGYPPGATLTSSTAELPYPGFAFTLTNVKYDGQRLQFDVATSELWIHWCELQTPIPDEHNAGVYSCVHNWPTASGGSTCSQTDPMTQMSVPINCGKLALCQGFFCRCDMQGCTVYLDSHPLHFDMVIAPPKANGSVRGLDADLHSVHLTKE
jgi:hypothetical protein